jgi:acetylornithine deacetylase/succinyl-diaminopimelate desuccinylase-like protein
MGARIAGLVLLAAVVAVAAEQAADRTAFEAETLRHFRALLRLDTSSPPGNEIRAVDYLRHVFDQEGLAYRIFARDPQRPNLVARLSGTGRKRPVLVMAHTDVVTVDPAKWTYPPFGGERHGGYVYGRGTVDDKDNLVAGLMLMLSLKRSAAALDRDVIFLAESGEEGAPHVGAQFMVDEHFDAIAAEFCLAEGGGVQRRGGVATQANIGTTEKEPRPIELVARGPSGHGSVPLKSNAVSRLSAAVGKVVAWVPPLRLTETTGAYFRALSATAPPDRARRYRDILSLDPAVSGPADEWLAEHEPSHWAMLHSSLTPTIISGGFRYNVIPSEARATIDTRLLPGEDQAAFLDQVRAIVGDAGVEVRWARDRYRPAGASSLRTEAFAVLQAQIAKHYDVPTLPTMGTGATDMSQMRSKGVQCYGIGPAIDAEDGPLGFGAHSDQERILETELHRFVGFLHDAVLDLARTR